MFSILDTDTHMHLLHTYTPHKETQGNFWRALVYFVSQMSCWWCGCSYVLIPGIIYIKHTKVVCVCIYYSLVKLSKFFYLKKLWNVILKRGGGKLLFFESSSHLFSTWSSFWSLILLSSITITFLLFLLLVSIYFITVQTLRSTVQS